MSKGVRLGLQAPQAGPNAVAGFVKDFIRRAHAGGFRMFWVGDHILMGGFNHRAKEHETFLEPLVLLSYIAGELDDVELGTSVLIAPYRNALSVMKSIATLAHLTQRRLSIGIGAGWAEHEFNALGAPFRARGRLTNEFCELFAKLRDMPEETWEVGPYRYGGGGFEPRLDANTNLWIGGNSAAARQRAARWGDGWQPTGLAVEDMRAGISELRAFCQEGERDFSEIDIGLRLRIRPTPEASPHYIGDLLGPYIDIGVRDFLLEINTRDRQRALDSIDRVVASARLATLIA
jgi:alkanesulfonate monooxygenase SsuD/methylene tetrahydromethanopterin reductase-like flavin-dependent oxidoreductase (luciferase family)